MRIAITAVAASSLVLSGPSLASAQEVPHPGKSISSATLNAEISRFNSSPTLQELENTQPSDYEELLNFLVESQQARKITTSNTALPAYILLDDQGEETPFILGGTPGVQPRFAVDFKPFHYVKFIYSQTDQAALKAGAVGAVATAVATAVQKIPNPWAKAMVSVVVGGAASAAAIYVGANGICPNGKNLVHTVAGPFQSMQCN